MSHPHSHQERPFGKADTALSESNPDIEKFEKKVKQLFVARNKKSKTEEEPLHNCEVIKGHGDRNNIGNDSTNKTARLGQIAQLGIQRLLEKTTQLQQICEQKQRNFRTQCFEVAKNEEETLELLKEIEKSFEIRQNVQLRVNGIKKILENAEEEVGSRDVVDIERDILVTIESETCMAEELEVRRNEKRIQARLNALTAANSLLQNTVDEAQLLRNVSKKLAADKLRLEEKLQFAKDLGILLHEDELKIKEILGENPYNNEKILSACPCPKPKNEPFGLSILPENTKSSKKVPENSSTSFTKKIPPPWNYDPNISHEKVKSPRDFNNNNHYSISKISNKQPICPTLKKIGVANISIHTKHSNSNTPSQNHKLGLDLQDMPGTWSLNSIREDSFMKKTCGNNISCNIPKCSKCSNNNSKLFISPTASTLTALTPTATPANYESTLLNITGGWSLKENIDSLDLIVKQKKGSKM